MRKSDLYIFIAAALGAALLFLLFIHPSLVSPDFESDRQIRKELVTKLNLTDLCLFTEARYTRHLSQADLFSAFQDHPLAMEHFPSGSLVRPPRHLIGTKQDDEP